MSLIPLFPSQCPNGHPTSSLPSPQETRGSVAVRVALGETQLVQEVRSFLIDNGVSLDSFSQVRWPRGPLAALSGRHCGSGNGHSGRLGRCEQIPWVLRNTHLGESLQDGSPEFPPHPKDRDAPCHTSSSALPGVAAWMAGLCCQEGAVHTEIWLLFFGSHRGGRGVSWEFRHDL